MAGTDPSAVTIDSVQYQVTVDLSQNPSGERRRLLVDGYSVLLVRPTTSCSRRSAAARRLIVSCLHVRCSKL